MKFLVTGANGQLGRETVLGLQAKGADVVGIGRQQLDFSRPDLVADGIASHAADWVINCAAYTQVDRAEDDPETAFLVNRDSPGAVAEGVRRSGGRLLHLSTDFVFDGCQSHPYAEDDVCSPLGVYGQSKHEGEQAVHASLPQAIVLRTAWVYGLHGNNFMHTMLRLAAERDALTVVDDQIGAPSATDDIFNAMWALMQAEESGLFHFTNEGVASWYDFAHEIVTRAQQMGTPIGDCRVRPIPTKDFPTRARRPHYSVLDKQKIRRVLGYPIPHWTESLERTLRALQDGEASRSS
jgi:dTDP-4-dehydrorhamnose reductase